MKYLHFNTKPQILINKKINTIAFERTYCVPYNKLDLFKIKILTNLLTYTTKDYPQENLYNEAKLKKLIMTLSCDYRIRGGNLFVSFYLTVPREGITSSFSLDDAFSLFVDSIYKPNVTNGAFDQKAFEREVSIINSQLDESDKDYYNKIIDQAMSTYDNEEISGVSLNKYRHILNSLTSKDIYEYYQFVIAQDPINLVFGNTTKKRIIDLFKKHNLYEEKKFKVEEKYFHRFPKVKKLKEKHIHSDYNQSCLFLGFKIKDYTLEESYYLSLIGDLLDGQECRMLFNALRIDNQLVYHYSSNGYLFNGGFVIYVYLQRQNKDKALEVLKETIAKLKDKEYIQEYIKKVIKGYNYDLIYELDSNDAEYRAFTRKLFHSLPGLKETIELYENMNIDSFIEFINRIELDTIYFAEGDKDE